MDDSDDNYNIDDDDNDYDDDDDFGIPPPMPIQEEDDPAGLLCEFTAYEARYNSRGDRFRMHVGSKKKIKASRSKDHDSALVLTRYYDRQGELERTDLAIRSPHIKKALREVVKQYPKVNLYASQIVITCPPKCLFHYRVELRNYLAQLEDNTAIEHLELILQYMTEVLRDQIFNYFIAVEAVLDPLSAGPKIYSQPGLEFQDLWMAFRPGCHVYMNFGGIDRAFRFKSMKRCNCPKPDCNDSNWQIEVEEILYDGKNFGYDERLFRINPYEGHMPFEKLNIFPLEYHPKKKEVIYTMVERGKRFVALRDVHHRVYEGVAEGLSPFRLKTLGRELDYFPLRSMLIKGRVLVDTRTFNRMTPSNKVEIVDELEPRKVPKVPGGPPQFGDDDFMICTHMVPGFSLASKRWCFFDVAFLKDADYNTQAFKMLILPEEQKKMIHSLVKIHADENLNFDDVIKGKGKGMIFLLHGVPGVGKTLTAESIADHTKRPLYTISSGELGTDAKSIEENLSVALELATTWKAILLIDEADVFLEQRSAHDLKRNGLVSIFLRLLEYYEGILFLTTNRISTFDKAFKSRIHLAIKYYPLSPTARKELWMLFMRNTYPDSNLKWMNDTCLEELGAVDLNGREIKNAFRTAHALAVSSGEEFSRAHIDVAIRGIKTFEADLNGDVDDAGSESEQEPESESRPSKRRRK